LVKNSLTHFIRVLIVMKLSLWNYRSISDLSTLSKRYTKLESLDEITGLTNNIYVMFLKIRAFCAFVIFAHDKDFVCLINAIVYLFEKK